MPRVTSETEQDQDEAAAQAAQAAQVGMKLAYWERVQPDAPAVLSPTGDRSFRELNENSNRLARALRARGLRAGDAVALVSGNRPEFAEVIHACMRAGVRYTPVNPQLTPDEVAYIVADSQTKALIGDVRFADLMTRTADLAPDVSVRLAIGGPIPGYEAYDAALSLQDPTDLLDPELGRRILYTSGTTGRPKGVVRPPVYSTGLHAVTTGPEYAPGTGQLNLCTGPLCHGGPLTMSMLLPLAAGVGIVLMERWDAEQALRLIAQHRITHTHMVPTMFHRLLRLPADARRSADVSSMRYILHGGAPCPVETKQAMMDWFGPIIWEYYAATEGAGASVGPLQWLEKPGTVGRPPSGDHVRILDDSGSVCPPGQPGTIYLKVLADAGFEYFGDPEKTEKTRRGTHFTVGDVGYLDADGFLFLTDRSSDLIVSGGVNIYPAEVEAILLQHPAVRDAAVVGVPSAEWGEEVKGVVEYDVDPIPTHGASALSEADRREREADLIAFCSSRLARFKCPRSIDFVDSLPRHENGKLYKRRLRDSYRVAAPCE